MPWICVRDANGSAVAASEYNVQQVPTFFLIDKSNTLQKRDAQIKDINAEIKSMLCTAKQGAVTGAAPCFVVIMP